MKVVFPLVVALFGALSNAKLVPLEDLHLEKAIEQGYASYEKELDRGSFKYYMNKMTDFSQGMGLMRPAVGHPPCECGKCVRGVVVHIMESVEEHIKHFCAKTECPVMKKRCEEMKEHKGETLGYMIGAVRPFEKGFAYCFGKGECPHPHPPRRDDEISQDVAKGGIVSSEESCEEIMTVEDDKFIREDFDTLIDDAIDTPVFFAETNMEAMENDAEKCRGCIRKVAGQVFMKTVERIKERCEKAKCPFVKRKCAMAKRHPHVAAGLIWYKLRPVEWSCGFCIGDGSCTKKDDMKFSTTDIPEIQF